MKKTIIILSVLFGLCANAQSFWSLTGNSGTNSSTNFIGTTDATDVIIKSNNREVIRIFPNAQMTVNSFKTNFRIDEWTDSFRIHNAPNVYDQFRVDGENKIVYMEEDELGGGKVVIGSQTLANCSDCNDYKLFVKKGIRTEKVKVDIAASNGWADYVFAKDYQLMPLKELDLFITKNGHLPEVPTTEEAIKNGIELKEMNILLLKKIEELTLYTIDQQKRIEALEKKIK